MKDEKKILKKVKEMLKTNTEVNWSDADYTPQEEFQNILDEIDAMEEKK